MKQKLPSLDALTRKSTAVSGITLRPLTLGSYSLGCRVGLKILKGVPAGTQADPAEQMYEVAAFAYMHSAPIDEVLTVIDAGDKAFRRAVDNFAMGLSLSDSKALMDAVADSVSDAFSTLAAPIKTEGSAPDEFAAKNGRGRRERRP